MAGESARAAEITGYQPLVGPLIINIDDTIVFGDEQKFAKLNHAGATVRLTGPGGQIIAAIDIAKMIWKRGYTSLVYRENGRRWARSASLVRTGWTT